LGERQDGHPARKNFCFRTPQDTVMMVNDTIQDSSLTFSTFTKLLKSYFFV